MWPVSEAFSQRVRRSHTICTKCEVYQDGVYIQDLKIYDGSVSMSYQLEIQRRCTVYLGDPDGSLSPNDLFDLLAPTGNEIKLYRGVVLADGTEEFVPLGVYPISVTDITESGDGHTIRLDCFDRSSKVARNKWQEPYIIPEFTATAEAIQDLVLSRFPAANFINLATTNWTLPQVVFDVESDPWARAQALARDIGCDLFFDGNGDITLKPVTNPALGNNVWLYAEGEEATFLSVNKRWKNTDLVNWWVVNGESTANVPAVSAQAYDNNPSSPTYVFGRYGVHLKRHRSNMLVNADQAQVVADSLLYQSLGSYEEVRFNAIVHPAHEPGDMVFIYRPRLGVNNSYILDKITIPMTAQRAMEIGTRQTY